uniref:Protein4 n=1 Tax=Alternaria solani chrysovirus 1 TaxID=2870620 RepID=A0A8K1JZG5_9VIRU|nr:protein4 [Alternaria solani chrysovirus 1]
MSDSNQVRRGGSGDVGDEGENSVGRLIKGFMRMSNMLVPRKRGEGVTVGSSVASSSGTMRHERNSRVRELNLKKAFNKAVYQSKGVHPELREGLEMYRTSIRPNLYAIVMPAGHGKTTMADMFNCLDVDDLAGLDGKSEIMGWLADVKTGGDLSRNSWVRNVNRALDMMSIEETTVIMVHDHIMAEMIGAVRAGTVIIPADVVSASNTNRGREWNEVRRVTEEMAKESNVPRKWAVSTRAQGVRRVARMMNSLGCALPPPSVCFFDNGTHRMEDYDKFRFDIEAIEEACEEGLVSEVTLFKLEVEVGLRRRMPMRDYGVLAGTLATRGSCLVAEKRGGPLKKALLWDKMNLADHEDAVEIDRRLVRSSDRFSNAIVLWWKMVGQECSAPEELFKLILGVQEMEWTYVMEEIISTVESGSLGRAKMTREDVEMLKEATTLATGVERMVCGGNKDRSENWSMEKQLESTCRDISVLVDTRYVDRAKMENSGKMKCEAQWCLDKMAEAGLSGEVVDVSSLCAEDQYRIVVLARVEGIKSGVNDMIDDSEYVRTLNTQKERKRVRKMRKYVERAMPTVLTSDFSKLVETRCALEAVYEWAKWITGNWEWCVEDQISMTKTIRRITIPDSVEDYCSAVTSMYEIGYGEVAVVLAANLMRNSRKWDKDTEALMICMSKQWPGSQTVARTYMKGKNNIHRLCSNTKEFGSVVWTGDDTVRRMIDDMIEETRSIMTT